MTVKVRIGTLAATTISRYASHPPHQRWRDPSRRKSRTRIAMPPQIAAFRMRSKSGLVIVFSPRDQVAWIFRTVIQPDADSDGDDCRHERPGGKHNALLERVLRNRRDKACDADKNGCCGFVEENTAEEAEKRQEKSAFYRILNCRGNKITAPARAPKATSGGTPATTEANAPKLSP